MRESRSFPSKSAAEPGTGTSARSAACFSSCRARRPDRHAACPLPQRVLFKKIHKYVPVNASGMRYTSYECPVFGHKYKFGPGGLTVEPPERPDDFIKNKATVKLLKAVSLYLDRDVRKCTRCRG